MWRVKWLIKTRAAQWCRFFSTLDLSRLGALILFLRIFCRRTDATRLTKGFLLPVKGVGTVRLGGFSDFYIYWEIFVERSYDLDVPPPRVIVDIGANVGMFALRMRMLYPDAQIFCFEPYPPNFGRLQQNVGHLRGVHANPVGVSDAAGTMTMYVHPSSSGGHTIMPQIAEPGASQQQVEIISLQEVRDIVGQPIDMMKADCEGAEGPILFSLRDKSIPVILYEATSRAYDPAKLKSHLIALGYDWVSRHGLGVAVSRG